MSSGLHLSAAQLLSGIVEGVRLEFKASWDPETTGQQVLQTICAFANDLQNLNGGYLLIGVAEEAGRAARPVKGLSAPKLEAAQRWITGNCNRLKPAYMPVLVADRVDGELVLVVWAPPSDLRPHMAPDGEGKEPRHFVRVGSQTLVAKDAVLQQLLQQTARVPFDDRRAAGARVEDLREGRVREFLRDIDSALLDEPDPSVIYRSLALTRPVNGHEEPRNVGLLFFSEDPERWFRGVRIEVVQFEDDAGGNTLQEKVFRGPVHEQLKQSLSYVESMSTAFVQKVEGKTEARGWVSFPVLALREALGNAVYHRGYEDSVEPIKVYLYPDRVEVTSYPGPVSGIERGALASGAPLPAVPARNRRIGELLKELRLAEGRGTGLPKIRRAMRQNGSPDPIFDFDDARTWFRVRLPAHPEMVVHLALREAAYLELTGDSRAAVSVLRRTMVDHPESAALGAALIRSLGAAGELDGAREVTARSPRAAEDPGVLIALAEVLQEAGHEREAGAVLERLPALLPGADAVEAALVELELDRVARAHQLFLAAGEAVLQDTRALHGFARSKIALASSRSRQRSLPNRGARERLWREAEELLERALQLEAPDLSRAWLWTDLAVVRAQPRVPAAPA